MSNPYDRLLRLLPQYPEYIATILNEDHPNYRVQLNDNSGVAMCTSAAKFQLGDRVYVSNGEIKRLAPIGNSYLIEV